MRVVAFRFALAIVVLALGSACDRSEPEIAADTDAPRDASAPADGDATEVVAPAIEPVPEATGPAAVPIPAPPLAAEPIATRMAERAKRVRRAPDFAAPFRGKLPRGEAFSVYAIKPATGDREDCRGDGWGQVAPEGWVCLESTVPSKAVPAVLPRLSGKATLPFHYARLLGRSGQPRPPAPRFENRAALLAGLPPVDFLAEEHDYAFARRRGSRVGKILVDSSYRAVRESDVRRLVPSELGGRELQDDPLPTDTTLAFSIVYKHATVRDRPALDAAQVSVAPLHQQLIVRGASEVHDGQTWWPIDGGGWVSEEEVQLVHPGPRPAGVGDEEIWVDVNVQEQTLMILRGDTPVYATVISSGGHKHPTRPGIYRISAKHTTTDMRSREGEDEPYHVESVPWVMYFDGDIALHGAFWHSRFGRRMSHGCVNLAPRDARRVFELVAPQVRPGWVITWESPAELGSVVVVRRGDAMPPDRRGPVLDRGD